MNNSFLIMLAILTLGFLSAHAFAMDVQATFNKLDKDSDGTLSEDEARADAVLHENFAQIDANQDAVLSLTEFETFVQ